MKNPVRLLLTAAFFAFITLTLSCLYRSGEAPTGSNTPTIKTPTPFAGWGPGQVIAHGYTQSLGHMAKAWPSGSSSIHVADEGSMSLWPGYVKSSGYWQILSRWQGKGAPPKSRYTILVTTIADVKSTGDSTCMAKATIPEFDKDPPMSNTVGVNASNDDFSVTGTVQHNSSGFYLLISTPPVSGEVRQAKFFHQWGGDVTTQVKFSQPKQFVDLRRTAHRSRKDQLKQ